jgi:methionine sulfoxide reductase heme-binding subunit
MPFLREKTGRWSPEKIAAFAIAIAPALWLIYLTAAGDLGARPVTEALHFIGRTTVRLILAALLVTPARRLLNWGKLINARRTLGVAAGCYALLHFALYVVDQKFDLAKVASEIALRFYLTIGFVALIGLIALLVTSTDAAVRRLGPRWGTLHRTVYVIGVLAVVHFALQKKLDIYEPTLMMGLLAWLLAYRALYKWRRAVGLGGLVALAVFATLFTMLFEAAWYGALTGVPLARVLAFNFNFASFNAVADIRPAWWVGAASLVVIAAYLAALWLRPRAPAPVKLRPAE